MTGLDFEATDDDDVRTMVNKLLTRCIYSITSSPEATTIIMADNLGLSGV